MCIKDMSVFIFNFVTFLLVSTAVKHYIVYAMFTCLLSL